jgi:branched-chain amino acid transport system permease protein
VRDEDLRQSGQAAPLWRQGAPRLRILAGAMAGAALVALAGCSIPLETDQARLCRMALPALSAPDARITIQRQQEDADGKGLRIDYREHRSEGAEISHVAECRFRAPGRPLRSEELASLAIDGAPLDDVRRYFLVRFWLATPEARAADPSPLGDVAGLPDLPPQVAYVLQQAINGLPLTAVYALLAAAYSLVYGLVGRINLAFGELAAAGGYAAALGAGLMAGESPAVILAIALVYAVFVAATWGMAASRWALQPLHRANGQIVLVATIGLALFMREFLRLTQGPRLNWVSPILNAPFGIARAGDFIVTTAPNALMAAALALAAGGALIALMARTRFGRDWRAYADDPLGAQLFGVDPASIFARTFALASGFAGLAGYVMTMFYGAVGYGAATTLGLKALVAAILGGIGSISGAFLGGLLVGAFEALWSSAFPIDYRDVAVFSLLAIVLTLRPEGILGVREFGGR